MAPAVIDVDRFYRDVLYELGQLAVNRGTATGAAAVVKRVALSHGVPAAEYTPLPRLSRAELRRWAPTASATGGHADAPP